MYAVIFWKNNGVYPCLTEDLQIKIFLYISEADDYADKLEDEQNRGIKEGSERSRLEARVISIETTKE